MSATKRRFYAVGTERLQFRTTDGTDPATDSDVLAILQAGDVWEDVQGTAVRKYTRTAAATWKDMSHWDNINGKPSQFPPEPHALDPDSGGDHTGTLHIKHLLGHDFTEPVHQRLLAAGQLER